MKNSVKVLLILALCSFSLSWINIQRKPWATPEKYQTLKNPYSETSDTKLVGKTQYKIHCSSCHGTLGLGDGVKSKRLKSPVPDFSGSEFQNQKDGEIYYKSFIGRDEMPNFENKIPNEKDRWLLINYIRKMKK